MYCGIGPNSRVIFVLLADRACTLYIGYWHDIVCLSVCLSVCDAARCG